jgi:hypothetical protein
MIQNIQQLSDLTTSGAIQRRNTFYTYFKGAK